MTNLGLLWLSGSTYIDVFYSERLLLLPTSRLFLHLSVYVRSIHEYRVSWQTHPAVIPTRVQALRFIKVPSSLRYRPVPVLRHIFGL